MSKPTRPTWEGIPETGLGADPSPGYDEYIERCIAYMDALEAEVERCRFIAASGARDFEIQRERIAELEAEKKYWRHRAYLYRRAMESRGVAIDNLIAENAELQKTPNELRRVLASEREKLTRAVELLGKVRDAHHLPGSHCEMEDAVVEVDAFLSEMEDTDGQD
jgi:hypothetical protein